MKLRVVTMMVLVLAMHMIASPRDCSKAFCPQAREKKAILQNQKETSSSEEIIGASPLTLLLFQI